ISAAGASTNSRCTARGCGSTKSVRLRTSVRNSSRSRSSSRGALRTRTARRPNSDSRAWSAASSPAWVTPGRGTKAAAALMKPPEPGGQSTGEVRQSPEHRTGPSAKACSRAIASRTMAAESPRFEPSPISTITTWYSLPGSNPPGTLANSMAVSGTHRGSDMKAAVLREINKPLEIENIQHGDPGPREVLIRTAAAGVCHSDLHFQNGSYPYPLPAVLGHESAGIVEAVGSDVTYVKPGDHVITCLSAFCGHCEYCLTGHMSLCQEPELQRAPDQPARLSKGGETIWQFLNLSSFAEYMLVHEHAIAKIRED